MIVSAYYLTIMTDIEFDDFLNYQPLSYYDDDIHQGFDLWSGETFLESHAAARPVPFHAKSLDDIEHIYTELHKGVDQVISKISVRTPPRLDQIKEQNRKLIDKLTTLESAITGDATAVVLGSGSPVCPSTGAETASASIPNTPSVSPFPCRKCVDIASHPRPVY